MPDQEATAAEREAGSAAGCGGFQARRGTLQGSWKGFSAVLGLMAALAMGTARGQATGGSAPVVSPNTSLRHEVQRAIDKGAAWLEKNQDPKGFWSTADHPAVTALVLVALQGQPSPRLSEERARILAKGYEFLLGCVKPNGAIYAKEELVNYNTSLSVMALLAANQSEYRPIILKARNYIAGIQSDFDQPGQTDNALDGGIGYGSRPHSDLSNTMMALEALYYSRRLLEDQNLAEAQQLNWAAAIEFIQRCQNLPSHNPQPWASDDPQNKGGFVYFPGHSMAGETNLTSGRVALRSYGSISYAGLLSYIYADLKRDDPRVMAVLDWLQAHYTLEENPGMGPQGQYYYYHTMAKALSTYGLDELETRDGRKHDWRSELALRLINLQQPDGSWMNENGRWWEKDPALVTAYAIISLEFIHRDW